MLDESYPPVTAETAFTVEYLFSFIRLVSIEMVNMAKFQSGFIVPLIACLVFAVYSVPFITANIVYFAGYLLIGREGTAEKRKTTGKQIIKKTRIVQNVPCVFLLFQ